MKERYGNGSMALFGWLRKQTTVIESRDNVWLRKYFTEHAKHNDNPGVKYRVKLIEPLLSQVLDRIVHPAIGTFKIPGKVVQVTYHRANQNSVGQTKDEFEMACPPSAVTIIASFTSLDV